MAFARLLSLLLLPPAMAVGMVYLGTGSVWFETPRAGASGRVVTWGGRAFTNRRGFAMWFESTGRDYRAWAKRHPTAAARLGRRPRPRRAAPPSTRTRVEASQPAVRSARLALLALGSGAAALVAIAVVRRLPRISIPTVSLAGYGAGAARLLVVPGASATAAERMLSRRPRAPPPAARLRILLRRLRKNTALLLSWFATATREAVCGSRALATRLPAAAVSLRAPARGLRAGTVAAGEAALRLAKFSVYVDRVSARGAGLVVSGALRSLRRAMRRRGEDIALGLVGLVLALVAGILVPMLLTPR